MALQALGQSARWMAVRLVAPMLGTAVMAVVALFVARQVTQMPPILALSIIAGSGAAAYLMTLAVVLGGRMPAALRQAA
ncbi:hypothetical protein ACFQY5_10785 [Paeniroseomonas aquatica]